LFDQILIFTDEFKDKCVLAVACPQRRYVFLLGCDSAAASVSAVALFNFKIKQPGNRRFINTNKIKSYVDKVEAAYAGTGDVQSIPSLHLCSIAET
jgi:hypothetical protein